MGQLRENHKITNMYQKARVDDLESSTRSPPNRSPPNTPEKSQLKKWLGIAGAIALLIVIATAIGYTIYHTQSKTADEKAKEEEKAIKETEAEAEAKDTDTDEEEGVDSDSEDNDDDGDGISDPPTLLALKKIQMGIHSGAGCGSEDGVRIEVKSNAAQCITEPYGPFTAGDTLTWTGEQLGNCTTAQFDPMEEKISLLIKTNIHDSFCPISVKIVLDDFNTYYMLRLPEEPWHNDDDKQNKTYTAKKGGSEKAMSIVISEKKKIFGAPQKKKKKKKKK